MTLKVAEITTASATLNKIKVNVGKNNR